VTSNEQHNISHTDSRLLQLDNWQLDQMILTNEPMRVDVAPRLGGHSGQSTPHYCPPLIHLILPPPPSSGTV